MRALVLGGGRLALATVPRPARRESLIRVVLAGICGTDLEMLAGYAEFSGIPGHEFVGIVEEVERAEDRAWIGRRVVGEINVGCGRCPECAADRGGHCPRRTVLGIRGRDGAFAEHLALPVRNLHLVPADMSDETAVFAEPVAAACRILEQVEIAPGLRTAVIGDGRLGQVVAQVLVEAGADVTLYGRHPHKLAVADALGLRATAPDGEGDQRFDLVVEASGRPSGLEAAARIVRPLGRIVLKSTFHGEAAGRLAALVVKEITVIGSRCGPFARALDLLARGRVRVAPLVSGVWPLERHGEAFAAARTGLKALLRP